MRQLALVALYGKKPPELARLITECQRCVTAIFGESFQPYDLGQVHATITSLKRLDGSSVANLNFARFRNRREDMDFSGLLEFIRSGGQFPLNIQIGGFQDRDYPFTSGCDKPYRRTFFIQDDKVVFMGWPVRGRPWANASSSALDLLRESRVYPNTLDMIRRAFISFNIIHDYHATLTDVDNDFYFRIGLLEPSSLDSAQLAEDMIRRALGKTDPVIIEVSISDISIVSFISDTLPVDSTKAYALDDPRLTPEFVQSLYDDV